MNHTPAQIIAEIITSSSGALFSKVTTGPVPAWPLYIGGMADSDASTGGIFDTEGISQGRYLASGKYIQRHGIQVRAQSLRYPDAYTRLVRLTLQLARVKHQPVTLDSVSYTVDSIMLASSVFALGQDERRRHQASVNLTVSFI